jgi:hypothetical protein
MNNKTLVKLVVLAALTALAIPGPAHAQTVDTMSVSYQWTAPTTGSDVVHYVVEHEINGSNVWTTEGQTDTNSYTLDLTVGQTHRVRVAAVDAEGRQGPWSVPSDPHTPDPGAPGQPGKPILF